MRHQAKVILYVLVAVALVLVAASAVLRVLGDAGSSEYVMLWACFGLMLSCWVWVDSRIDL